MPKVSICVLAYNHAQLMKRSLDNLLDQTFQDFEMIISDDCSPDPDMETVCRDYTLKDPRVKYFRNPRNLGRIPNYNAATRQATGEYIAVVHDGDRYRPDLLEKWVLALDANPTAAFVFNSMEAIDWEGNHLKYFYHDYPPLIKGLDIFDEMLFRPDSPIFGMTMFRRSCYEQFGPFDEQFDIIGDVDMWMRFALHYDVVYLREALIANIPREKNHDTVTRVWETLRQNQEIHRVNAQRRFADQPQQLATALQRIDSMFQPLLMRQLLSCLKHGRGKLLREGTEYMRKIPNTKLKLVAAMLAPVSRLLPQQ